jgi:hypothetical protein
MSECYPHGQAFVVVTEPELKQRLGEICGERGFYPFISGAPVLVVPCTSEEVYRSRYRAPDVLSPSLKRGRKPTADVVHYNGWH